jgi:hypothetical protein
LKSKIATGRKLALPGGIRMAHDVFITSAEEDQGLAAVACAALEATEIKCWMASRNIGRKQNRKKTTEKAIRAAKVMVIIFSCSSNKAADLSGELNMAINEDLSIIPLRIDLAEPEGVMQYYLADTHWLDLANPPREEQLSVLIETVRTALKKKKEFARDKAGQGHVKKKSTPTRAGKAAAAILWATISAAIIYGATSIVLSLLRLSSNIGDILNAL